MKKKSVVITAAILALFLSGCATQFTGPDSYVGFSTGDGQLTAASQSSKVYGDGELQSTYEDEFSYDSAGNLLSHKQIQYFNDSTTDNKFVVWETKYKVVGGVSLPHTVSVNDTVYLEVSYSLLNTDAVGEVTQPIRYRSFIQHRYRNGMWGATYPFEWGIDLKNYPVDFDADGRYVTKDWLFSLSKGYHSENTLSLGYDNVVLTHYSFSDELLMEGFKKSFPGFIPMNISQRSNELEGSNFSFDYEWEVINGKICQRKVTFQQTYRTFNIFFTADADYNDAGFPIQETWRAAESPDGEKNLPVVIFQNNFEY